MKKDSQFRETLACFRDSVTHWTEAEGGRAIPHFEAEKPRVRPFRWAFVGALAGTLLVIPFYRSAVERQREAKALEDTLLLEQVNAYLSRTVPASMDPFVHLLSDGGKQ